MAKRFTKVLARLQQLKELSKAKRQVSQSLDYSIYVFFAWFGPAGSTFPKQAAIFVEPTRPLDTS